MSPITGGSRVGHCSFQISTAWALTGIHPDLVDFDGLLGAVYARWRSTRGQRLMTYSLGDRRVSS